MAGQKKSVCLSNTWSLSTTLGAALFFAVASRDLYLTRRSAISQHFAQCEHLTDETIDDATCF